MISDPRTERQVSWIGFQEGLTINAAKERRAYRIGASTTRRESTRLPYSNLEKRRTTGDAAFGRVDQGRKPGDAEPGPKAAEAAGAVRFGRRVATLLLCAVAGCDGTGLVSGVQKG
jgi:hypothetical protein